MSYLPCSKLLAPRSGSLYRSAVSKFRRQTVALNLTRMMSGSRSGRHRAASGESHAHTNRLIHEQSPYLLQHAHNPVDWYPWNAAALQKAKEEDKPIFLSVGYATCHWCHVMERESFESEEIAAFLNQHFVSIKVDREERPDVDKVYMAFVQASTGHGGWPMSVFLTPNLQPFYGGTYYPLSDIVQGGQLAMPGFLTVLRRIVSLWSTNKQDICLKGSSIMDQLRQFTEPDQPSPSQLGADDALRAMQGAVEQLGAGFDERLGGFGRAPKFPRPSEINLMLRAARWYQARGDDTEAERILHMALFTLSKMAAGGMYDHLAGGFHRYSVDEYWHMPHFEKMLYDNPQLACTYLDAFRMTGDTSHARVVRGILDYLIRDMTHPEGGLFSAEDADSLDPVTNEKKEGAYYVWDKQQIDELLSPEQAAAFNGHYNVKEEGNCTLSTRSDPHGEFGGKNVLLRVETLQQTAERCGLGEEEVETLLAGSRQVLDERRRQRPRPTLDNKVVTAWNGFGISAFALASRALSPALDPPRALYPLAGRPAHDYLQPANNIADFVRRHLFDASSGELLRAYCNGPADVAGFADDYALMVQGLLDLYETSGELSQLQWATALQQTLDRLFWDGDSGGYFQTTGRDSSVLLRLREDYDGAEPAASSIAATNCMRLAALLPQAAAAPQYAEHAAKCLAAFHERLTHAPMALPQMCCAAYLQLKQPLRQVIVSGKAEDPLTQQLLNAVHSVFVPDKVVIVIDPEDTASAGFWQQNNSSAWEMVARHQELLTKSAAAGPPPPTVFICQNYTCQAPTSDPQRVLQLLQAAAKPAPPTIARFDIGTTGIHPPS